MDELKEFVEETLKQVQEGSKGHTPTGDVEFEVAVAKTREANGKIGISVLGFGGAGTEGKIKDENISKIRFSVRVRGAFNKIAPMQWPPKVGI